jgi:hypothetical protein
LRAFLSAGRRLCRTVRQSTRRAREGSMRVGAQRGDRRRSGRGHANDRRANEVGQDAELRDDGGGAAEDLRRSPAPPSGASRRGFPRRSDLPSHQAPCGSRTRAHALSRYVDRTSLVPLLASAGLCYPRRPRAAGTFIMLGVLSGALAYRASAGNATLLRRIDLGCARLVVACEVSQSRSSNDARRRLDCEGETCPQFRCPRWLVLASFFF